jgi:hypothetical protein
MMATTLCDAPGDCNFDLAVTIGELETLNQIFFGNLGIADCHQGDLNGDGQISIGELQVAMNTFFDQDAHLQTSTIAPTFGGDGRHLTSSSSGWSGGLDPANFGVAVCRVRDCDADSHPRPNGSGYDIGAYEGGGQQSKSSACLNIGPGACFGSGSMMMMGSSPVVVTATPRLDCERGTVAVEIALADTQGDVAGLQVDLQYDHERLRMPEPQKACTIAMRGYGGMVLSGLSPRARSVGGGELRVAVSGFTQSRETFGDGVIAVCEFELAGAASEGLLLDIAQAEVVAASGEQIESVAFGAAIDVSRDCASGPELETDR